MVWRKSLVHLFSVILLLSLVGWALAVSANVALAPANVKSKLSQSKLYDHFIDNAIKGGQKAAGNKDQSNESGATSLSNPNVQQAAKAAFPPQLLQQSVNTFLDSNYAWLQGKTSQPNFVIDLTAAKQNFAQQVGKYAQTHIASLPICTNAELTDIPDPANIDPLAASCRPAQVSPETAGAKVTQEILSGNNFLSNPILTPQSINPKDPGAVSQQPYYEKLSKAPQAYRVGQKLPFILSVLALASTLGIILVAPLRRRGVRRVGLMLFTSGIILVIFKFVTDFGFNKLEHKIFNNATVGSLQQSLVDFAHRLQSQIVAVDIYFGTAFLLLALIIFIYLFKTRQTTDKPSTPGTPTDITQTQLADDANTDASTVRLAPRPRMPAADITTPKSNSEKTSTAKKNRPPGQGLIQ